MAEREKYLPSFVKHQIILNTRFLVNNWTLNVFNQVLLDPEREDEVSGVFVLNSGDENEE